MVNEKFWKGFAIVFIILAIAFTWFLGMIFFDGGFSWLGQSNSGYMDQSIYESLSAQEQSEATYFAVQQVNNLLEGTDQRVLYTQLLQSILLLWVILGIAILIYQNSKKK